MKIRVERAGFANAVAWVARSLPSRPAVPVLGGVLLDAGADADMLTVSGFDYEVSATSAVAATIAEPGRVLVSGRLLADITRALSADPIDIAIDGSRATVTCGHAKFSLPTMPVEEYPQLPEQPAVAGELAGEQFGQAVAQVTTASGKDDTLPMLTGLRLEITGDVVTMIATDRFRLAIKEFTWQPVASDAEYAVLVPAKALAEAAKSLAAPGTTVRLGLSSGESMIGLYCNRQQTTARLLDAEFPQYQKILPASHTSRAMLNVAALAEAIKRVSLVAEHGTRVRLEFGERLLRLTAGGDDEGSAEEDLPIEYEGEPTTIAFNPGYLVDGLNAVSAERAELTFTTPSRPALLRPADSEGAIIPGYQYLIMPVRLPG